MKKDLGNIGLVEQDLGPEQDTLNSLVPTMVFLIKGVLLVHCDRQNNLN